jgi:hypothetical protein
VVRNEEKLRNKNMIKFSKLNLLAVFAGLCGIAAMASTGTAATSCHATDGAIINIPFSAAVGVVTAGCSYKKAAGSAIDISGEGQADPAGTRKLCGNLVRGASVTVTGMESTANPIAGCQVVDSVIVGGFAAACDTTGCNTAVRFDTFVN